MRQEDLLKANTVCGTCGRKYYVCTKCAAMRNNGVDVWKLHGCSPECYQVYLVVNCYNNGEYTKEEAREMLANITGDIEIIEPMKLIVDEIMAIENKPVVKNEPQATNHRRHRR